MTEQVTLLSSEKVKKDDIKRQLLVSMRTKRQDVMKKLGQFMKQDLHAKEDYISLAKGIIEDVDTVLNEKEYESSLFLRNITKPLRNIRQNAVEVLERLDVQQEAGKKKIPVLQENMVPVYILLFQQYGHNMKNWEQLLGSLDRYVLGRPIFENEEEVQKVVRLKMSEEQEGYVKVAVAKSALESNSEVSRRTDRHGNTLLTLPAGSVSSDYILEFVHGKKRYYFIEGELVDVSSTTKRN
jgi:intracellular multiplication protein IcmQ